MLNSESGPGDVFGRLRSRIGVKYDEHSRPVASNWFAEGVLCFYCLSVWVALGVFLVLALMKLVSIEMIVLLPVTFSGGAVFIKKWVG